MASGAEPSKTLPKVAQPQVDQSLLCDLVIRHKVYGVKDKVLVGQRWGKVEKDYNMAVPSNPKTKKQLRQFHQNLKKKAKRKASYRLQEALKTGGGPNEAPPMDDEEERLLEDARNNVRLDNSKDCDGIHFDSGSIPSFSPSLVRAVSTVSFTAAVASTPLNVGPEIEELIRQERQRRYLEGNEAEVEADAVVPAAAAPAAAAPAKKRRKISQPPQLEIPPPPKPPKASTMPYAEAAANYAAYYKAVQEYYAAKKAQMQFECLE